MADIMTFIRKRNAFDNDPDGHLIDQGEWNAAIAERLAEEEGVDLTVQHWEVIHFLREWVRRNGEPESATMFMKYVQGRFASQGGRRFLYQLFPGGPLTQGCRIAGLPVPPNSVNNSFGTVQ
jgi:tRNA 2-thiouridine synthesizing protein E